MRDRWQHRWDGVNPRVPLVLSLAALFAVVLFVLGTALSMRWRWIPGLMAAVNLAIGIFMYRRYLHHRQQQSRSGES